MIRYRVRLLPELQDTVAHLAPVVKQRLRTCLRLLETDPLAGKPLNRELEGFRSYPIPPYRVVYRLEAPQRVVQVVAVGLRPTVYDLLIEQLHSQTGSSEGGGMAHDLPRRRRRWRVRRKR